ncbi:MAG: alanine--tRNA ligase [Candidatus Aenigmatarchaeota archaeon]|nr:MAG: alanine--tRNA ligase [Candidatus Aenigmarchaeota archaeon]
MLTKDGLKKEFSRDWKQHYQVGLFMEKGFVRKKCQHCGKHFWTLDPDRKSCGSPPCDNYSFIGNPATKVKWDYVEAWKNFEKFFKKHSHASVPRYPVIDRWRPDLYFTIASIQDFQRIDGNSVVMEYPSDPLVVPQVCLRFNDIPNVGVTGRHHTCFIMPGQHSFGEYWKDRTIELNYKFINGVMGVPEKDITYTEDMWAMPDFSQFGPCLETFSRGLELVNSVFSQFTASGSGYKELPQKVVDVGWGHERLVWFSNGTTTGYDAVFEPVMKWMLKKTGIKETGIFNRYSVLAGSLTVDEVDDMQAMRKKVADQIGTSVKELNSIVEPMQAMYAIADHAKSLLFAVTDGGIPSNVGGGYNLRVILRRSLSFMDEHGFGFDLNDVAEMHAKQLRPMFPELKDGLDPLAKVLDVEEGRYRRTSKKAVSIVRKELSKGIGEDDLVRLYTSNGISPEEVQKIAKENGKDVMVPDDIYSKITDQHMTGEKGAEKQHSMDVSGIPATKRLYYDDPYMKEFKAKVLKSVGEWIALDKTCFYPEGGGQPPDRGILLHEGKEFKVTDVQKIGEVIMHKIPGMRAKEGMMVDGMIDWDRRYTLMKMHSATHVLAGVTRNVIGGHIWQAGAQKGLKSSRLDLTHYERFTDGELSKIEKEVNAVIMRGLEISTRFYPRSEAESRYGFVLYQGGASPGKEVRVVSVKGLDVEACAGTHLSNTREIGKFKIIRSERIQDGVNRIEYAVSGSAEEFAKEEKALFDRVKSMMVALSKEVESIKETADISEELSKTADVFSVDAKSLPQTMQKFAKEIAQNQRKISKLSDELGLEKKPEKPLDGPANSMHEAAARIFEFWKSQRKEIDRMAKEKAKHESESLLSKARDNTIFEVLSLGRKELIETAGRLIDADPRLTVILANQAGDIVGMSKSRDMSREIKEICQKAGGSGGGRKEFAQGRVELSKLIKVMEKD